MECLIFISVKIYCKSLNQINSELNCFLATSRHFWIVFLFFLEFSLIEARGVVFHVCFYSDALWEISMT